MEAPPRVHFGFTGSVEAAALEHNERTQGGSSGHSVLQGSRDPRRLSGHGVEYELGRGLRLKRSGGARDGQSAEAHPTYRARDHLRTLPKVRGIRQAPGDPWPGTLSVRPGFTSGGEFRGTN